MIFNNNVMFCMSELVMDDRRTLASTSAIHVTYEGSQAVKANGGYAFDDVEAAAAFAARYQNTSFMINEYWSIGQVANLVNDNGAKST